MENSYITLHQLNSDRAEFAAFIKEIEKLGYKQGSDYFKNPSGNASAMFKSSVANDEKVKKLRAKYKITSFGLESVEATLHTRFSNFQINDKVKLFVEGKETIGTIVNILFAENAYEIKLKNNQIVQRNFHEVSKYIPKKENINENTSDLNKSLNLLINKSSPRTKQIYKELFENELTIDEKIEEILDEHHLHTRQEQEEFILSNSTDYTSEDLARYTDEEISEIYSNIEASLNIDEELEDEQEYKNTLIKTKLEPEYYNDSPEKFDPNYDFFGDTELNESDFDVLSDEDLEIIASEKNLKYENRKQIINDLLESGRFCKKDIKDYISKKKKKESLLVDSLISEALKDDWKFPAEVDYRYIDSRLKLGPVTEQYAILDNMDTATWNRYLDKLSEYGVVVEYDAVNDEFIVYRTEKLEDDDEIEERYEIEEEDKQTITNIAEAKGVKVIDVRGMPKNSNKSNIIEILIEKKGYQTKIYYDDNAPIKPWTWNNKKFNFLQEAIDHIYIPLEHILKESIEQEKQIIEAKKQEIKTLLERRNYANKTDKLPPKESQLRKQRSLEIMHKFLDEEMLKRKIDR